MVVCFRPAPPPSLACCISFICHLGDNSGVVGAKTLVARTVNACRTYGAVLEENCPPLVVFVRQKKLPHYIDSNSRSCCILPDDRFRKLGLLVRTNAAKRREALRCPRTHNNSQHPFPSRFTRRKKGTERPVDKPRLVLHQNLSRLKLLPGNRSADKAPNNRCIPIY